jgi:hypothetical protein
MRWLAAVVVALLLASAGTAAELVRVRVSQLDGSEPAALSSATHPDLFVLDPRIALAELVATNPASPGKADHGPGTWLPEQTPPQTVGDAFGSLELRVTPVSGEPVTFGVLHFRTGALAAGPTHFALTGPGLDVAALLPGSRALTLGFDPIVPTTLSLDEPATVTLLLDAPPSDQPASFVFSTQTNFPGTPGGPAGFRDVDLVLATPLCEAAPRAGCAVAETAKLRFAEGRLESRLAWRFTAPGALLAPLGPVDDVPLFGWCVYQDDGLEFAAGVGPDVCGKGSCWQELRRGYRYRDGGARLVLRAKRDVRGALEARLPFFARPPPPGALRSQLVRSDDAECFDAAVALP